MKTCEPVLRTVLSAVLEHPIIGLSSIICAAISVGWAAAIFIQTWPRDYAVIKENNVQYRHQIEFDNQQIASLKLQIDNLRQKVDWIGPNTLSIQDLPPALQGSPAYSVARIWDFWSNTLSLDIIKLDRIFVDLSAFKRINRVVNLNKIPNSYRRTNFDSQLSEFLLMIAPIYSDTSRSPRLSVVAEQVREFQRFCNESSVDGIVGPATWNNIEKVHEIIDSEFENQGIDPHAKWKFKVREQFQKRANPEPAPSLAYE